MQYYYLFLVCIFTVTIITCFTFTSSKDLTLSSNLMQQIYYNLQKVEVNIEVSAMNSVGASPVSG